PGATAGELRRAGRALAGATGALLAVRLLAAAGHHPARLGRMRALASRSALRHDHLVDERDVRRDVEHLGGELGGAGLLACGVEDVDGLRGSHGLTLPSRRYG